MTAYTTEFLDGHEARAVRRDHYEQERDQGHVHRGMRENMNKGTDKVRAGMDKKRLEYYKKKLLARRGELTKNIARTQEEGRTGGENHTGELAGQAGKS